jgi:hypothetical protein
MKSDAPEPRKTEVETDRRDWAIDAILTDLRPFGCHRGKGMQKYFSKRIPSMDCASSTMKTEVNAVVKECVHEVRAQLRQAKEDGCLMSCQVDSWKPNMKVQRRHYFTALVSWVDKEWVRHEVCIGVAEIKGSRTGTKYHDLLDDILRHVGLDPQKDIVAFLSGHEGAIRCGLKMFGWPVIGCRCNLF